MAYRTFSSLTASALGNLLPEFWPDIKARLTRYKRRFFRWCQYGLLLSLAFPCARAQDSLAPEPAALPSPSDSEKWNFFVSETLTPLTLAEGGLDATVSQSTRSAPLYGKHFWRRDAFVKRFGATLGDNISQILFSDFLLASAFHEDTRYVRKGNSRGMWSRIGYAFSRAVATQTDSGTATLSWANVVGCAMSAGLSNAYYPSVSRTASVGDGELGDQLRRRGFEQSHAGVRVGRRPLDEAASAFPLLACAKLFETNLPVTHYSSKAKDRSNREKCIHAVVQDSERRRLWD